MQDSSVTNGFNSPEPRFHDYPDDGCPFSDSCLNCPLPFCVEDLPPRQVAALKRTAKVSLTTENSALPDRVRTLLAQGITKQAAYAMLAVQDGVSLRTLYRRLHRCNNCSPRCIWPAPPEPSLARRFMSKSKR